MVANHHISLNRTRGYVQRPAAFPISIILCGVRDVRDYRIQTSGKDIITGGSVFNIKTTSLRLSNFTRQEVVALWQLANRIYQEVIPRELIWSKQARITHQQYWYLTPERRLDSRDCCKRFCSGL